MAARLKTDGGCMGGGQNAMNYVMKTTTTMSPEVLHLGV